MEIIKLDSPKRRAKEFKWKEFEYKITSIKYLPKPNNLPKKLFSQVLHSRKTRRDFKIISDSVLSNLLWCTAKTQTIRNLESGFVWQHRPVPSAGGIHPIDMLICNYKGSLESFNLYDSLSHSLCKVEIDKFIFANHLITNIKKTIEFEEATLIIFAAQFNKTIANYKNGESLVWRDSGALLSTISLVAEYLELNCCGIGITCEPWLSKALNSNDLVLGVGGCLLGERK